MMCVGFHPASDQICKCLTLCATVEIVELCSWTITCKTPSRSRKLTKVMHEFTKKFGMTFANFLELGPHSQPKRKLIDISGEWGHYLYLNKKGLHIGSKSIHIATTRCTKDK